MCEMNTQFIIRISNINNHYLHIFLNNNNVFTFF